MLRPVGSLPSSVYWRRRLLFLVVALVLIVLTGYVLLPGGGGPPAAAPVPAATTSAAPTRTPTAPPTVTPTTASPTAPTSDPAGTSAPVASSATASSATASAATSAATSPAASPAAAAAPAACNPADLRISAQPSAAVFKAGEQPTLYLQVVNPGPAPCVQDLADAQVELRIFNGQSRVWGSHDCVTQPGTDVKTLLPNTAAQVGVQWSGLTSQPGCQGLRQRVGAGSYTVYALLSGVQGTPATITMS